MVQWGLRGGDWVIVGSKRQSSTSYYNIEGQGGARSWDDPGVGQKKHQIKGDTWVGRLSIKGSLESTSIVGEGTSNSLPLVGSHPKKGKGRKGKRRIKNSKRSILENLPKSWKGH